MVYSVEIGSKNSFFHLIIAFPCTSYSVYYLDSIFLALLLVLRELRGIIALPCTSYSAYYLESIFLLSLLGSENFYLGRISLGKFFENYAKSVTVYRHL